MGRFLEQLSPTYITSSVETLTPDLFEKNKNRILGRVDAVAFDVDGTLMNHHDTELDDSVKKTLYALSETGLRLFIISNAYGSRVDELHDLFSKGFDMRVITPVDVAGTMDPKKFRKPNPNMIQLALSEVGEHEEFMMVGDQMLKDVLSARRADVLSMLVPRRGEGDDWRVKLLQRPVENLLRRCINLPEDTRDFPDEVLAVGCLHQQF